MRAEKQTITQEYLERLNASPFFIVVDYCGLKVGPITELRKRLRSAEAEMHVVKNTLFRLAAKEAGIADLGTSMTGQKAVITGDKDISAAAKVLKTFASEFVKPEIQFGYLNNEPLDAATVQRLADLPSKQVLRSTLLALFNAPATQLVRLMNTPATQLARVLKAKAEKE